MNISSKTKICMIIGDPVEHSLSPHMHNSAYKALGIDNEFVFVAARVAPEHLGKAIEGIRAFGIRGVTVTIPHKTQIMKLLDGIDTVAEKIGAVNTIVNNNGKLTGYNTDWIGIATPLKDHKGKTVAILGAGGAARAAVYAAKQLNMTICIFNRTIEHAKNLAEEFVCEYASIDDSEKIKSRDVIINTTSVGLESNKSPISENAIAAHQIVFDIVYKPYETKLLKIAKEKGATIIHGTEMLLDQGLAQFALYTGKKAPEDIMRKAILSLCHSERNEVESRNLKKFIKNDR